MRGIDSFLYLHGASHRVCNSTRLAITNLSPKAAPKGRTDLHSSVLSILCVLACLLPFSNKAFHIDDPLFVWTGQHIAKHPFDPYGFRIVWYDTEMPMSEITKNPPLASYYGALVGGLGGWSERALHLGFLLPAIGVVLGTQRLARRFTKYPVLAAVITLLTPGFLVSSSSVMCDTMMLALWVFAVIYWLEGLDSGKQIYLLACALLIAACALTKYFGAALIPLLLAYSLFKKRRFGIWVCYLFVPVVILLGYQYVTHALYGRGLLSDAAQFANLHNHVQGVSIKSKALIGLAFAGGCVFPVIAFGSFLWSRRQIMAALIFSSAVGLALAMRWLPIRAPAASAAYTHWHLVSGEMAFYIIGGISIFGLIVADGRRGPDCDWGVLSLWIVGTFLFACFVNWTINVRSILPMIPAVAILIARRLEAANITCRRQLFTRTAIALLVSGILSMWVAWGDAALANSGRTAARLVQYKTRNAPTPVYFEGHWGFQYYMEEFHALPVDLSKAFHAGDILVIPENNANIFGPPSGFTPSGTAIEIKLNSHLTTMSPPLGAGFYASAWGPLPFAVGSVEPDRYRLYELAPLENGLPAAAK